MELLIIGGLIVLVVALGCIAFRSWKKERGANKGPNSANLGGGQGEE